MKKTQTQLMGILNCTPDSYFEGGRYLDCNQAVEYGLSLFEQGANILDIGGESTAPQSKGVSEEEELERVIPVVEGIRKHSDLPLSIDTFKPGVARAALKAGVNMLNDITGFTHPEMRQLAIQSGAQLVIMHAKGSPHSCPTPSYPNGVVSEICSFLTQQATLLIEEGVDPSQIILDPGIGGGSFGKTPQQSLQILKNLKAFCSLDFPVLISLSRKSFLQKILKKEASQLLSTTLALNTMSALEGVAYLRVHDVAEHRLILTVLETMDAIED
ncbi:MAG: Dihydropteroate synthase [Chlamydiales bacterium]|nr:Dihydropteroate synthase [Chlamydiales bacterium]